MALACFYGTAGFSQTADSAPSDKEGNTIIVTGSRIARPLADTPNPVISITAANLQQSGTSNVTDYLKTVPALVNSLTSFDNSGDRAQIGFTGLNLLDLRNLGYQRTLVLVDGRRHVAAVDGLQAVDINTIPEDLIESVDVLTGGASAIYGADGVSGVVNFIQKKDFEGLNVRAQGGISSRGDAGQRLFAITVGHNFAEGRGNIAIAYEHGEEDRLQQKDRPYLTGANRIGFYENPDYTGNRDGVPLNIPLNNIRYNDTSRQGGIDVDLDGIPDFVGANGTPYDPGRPIPPFYQQGGSGTLVSDYGNDLLPSIKRNVVNAIGHFEFSSAFELYGEAKYARIRSYSLSQPSFDYYLHIPEDNPFIPASVRPLIDPAAGYLFLNRDNFDLGQRGEDITRETIRTVIGAKGALSNHLKYDVSYVFGRANITNHYIGDILTDRYYAAIDAVQGPNGITCRVNLDPTWTPDQPDNYTRNLVSPTTFSPGQCIPLNLFGEGMNSKTAVDWIKTDTTDRTRLTQHVASAALTGDTGAFLKLPGGPIGFAVGAEYRKEESSFVADPLARQGLTFSNSLGNSKGQFDVKEAFVELNVPVLADVPLAHRLDVGGAFRYSDYSTIGTTNAWKVDATYAPVRDITFRGTYSVAVRAPNISELFGANSQTFETINDPCNTNNLNNGTSFRRNNCAALLSSLGVADPSSYVDTRSVTLPGFTTSNSDLEQEKAKTWTVGVVLQPSFVPRLIISADWYDINIENAITTATAEQLANLCVDQPTINNQYCGLVERSNGGSDPGTISTFTLKPFNVSNYTTSGLDVAINYIIPTQDSGTFNLRLVGNYLHTLSFIPIPGAPAVNNAYIHDSTNNITSPKYQVTADIGWQKGAVNFNWQVQYWSKTYRFLQQEIVSNPDIAAPEYKKFKEKFVNNLYLAVDVSKEFQLYGGVDNLFDVKPDIGSIGYPVSAVGRYLYMGVKVKLADLFR